MNIVRPPEKKEGAGDNNTGFRKQHHRDLAEAVLAANPHLRN